MLGAGKLNVHVGIPTAPPEETLNGLAPVPYTQLTLRKRLLWLPALAAPTMQM